MDKRSFRRSLEEADRAFELHGMPPSTDARLRRRLFEPAPARRRALPRRPWVWALGLSGATAALLLLWLRSAPPPAAEPIGGLTAVRRSPDLRVTVDDTGRVEVSRGEATFVAPRWRGSLRTIGRVSLRRESAGLRVLRGRVAVHVSKERPELAPVRILVSHGAIEVVGTRFEVNQTARGGSVRLEEGVLRFVATDGQVRLLAAGQVLSWPLPPREPTAVPPRRTVVREPRPPLPASAPHPRPRPSESERVGALLRRLGELRSRARYAQAADLLRSALRRRWRPSTRERLGFELGAILTYHLSERERACAFWQEHRRRFPGGEYAAEVRQAEAYLRCAPGDAREEEP